jgi:hypothetical protein
MATADWFRCLRTLNGLHIDVAVTGYPPFTTYDANGAIAGGADLDLLDITAEKLNFTYEKAYSPIWGQQADSGVWQGVVGSVSITHWQILNPNSPERICSSHFMLSCMCMLLSSMLFQCAMKNVTSPSLTTDRAEQS